MASQKGKSASERFDAAAQTAQGERGREAELTEAERIRLGACGRVLEGLGKKTCIGDKVASPRKNGPMRVSMVERLIYLFIFSSNEGILRDV